MLAGGRIGRDTPHPLNFERRVHRAFHFQESFELPRDAGVNILRGLVLDTHLAGGDANEPDLLQPPDVEGPERPEK